MSSAPSFDELVGSDTTSAERARLRRAHELLLEAGPPPELPPQLASVPGSAIVRRWERRRLKRRAFVFVAAALAVAVASAAGYALASHGGGGAPAVRTVALKGTAAAPDARGGDSWLVTREARGGKHGTAVLRRPR